MTQLLLTDHKFHIIDALLYIVPAGAIWLTLGSAVFEWPLMAQNGNRRDPQLASTVCIGRERLEAHPFHSFSFYLPFGFGLGVSARALAPNWHAEPPLVHALGIAVRIIICVHQHGTPLGLIVCLHTALIVCHDVLAQPSGGFQIIIDKNQKFMAAGKQTGTGNPQADGL